MHGLTMINKSSLEQAYLEATFLTIPCLQCQIKIFPRQMVTMKLRRPYTTASMWSSGKITCTGANSEDQAKVAARRYTRLLQKLGFNVKFRNFRVVNVLGT